MAAYMRADVNTRPPLHSTMESSHREAVMPPASALCIFIINQDFVARHLAAAALFEALPGARIFLFEHAQEAYAQAQTPHLIVLDLEQSGLVGLEGVGRIKARFASAALVVLSDNATVHHAVETIAMGAADYLVKPVKWPQVAARACLSLPSLALSPTVTPPSSPQTPTSPSAAGLPDETKNIIKPLWQQEKHYIEQALSVFHGAIGRAAAALQISPSTIYRKQQEWLKHETHPSA